VVFVLASSLWLFLLPFLLNGCVPASHSVSVDESVNVEESVSVDEKSVTNHSQTDNGSTPFAPYSQVTDDLERLNKDQLRIIP
jgi:hypothetical protein